MKYPGKITNPDQQWVVEDYCGKETVWTKKAAIQWVQRYGCKCCHQGLVKEQLFERWRNAFDAYPVETTEGEVTQ